MNKQLSYFITLFLFVLGLTAGCGQKPVMTVTLSQAHQKLLTILKEDYALDVVTREFKNTLWIYLPIEESFFEIKAKTKQPAGLPHASTVPTIYFLDAAFLNHRFTIDYDIGSTKQYAKNLGYEPTFSQDFQSKQRNILTAISRSFTDAGNAPSLFMIAIADIVHGLESRTLLHLKDLKRAYTDQTFQGEYAKRVISNQPFGDKTIIGDKEGRHVDFKDITWPEFLARQMVYRINFKYTRSAFPPSDDARSEALKAVAETVNAYKFTDFQGIQLHNLETETVETITPEKLASFTSEPSKGRFIHIKF